MDSWTVLAIAVVVPIAILAVGFWIWMLFDCVKHESSEGNDKLVWVIIIVAMKLFGAILFYFVRRPRRIRLAAG